MDEELIVCGRRVIEILIVVRLYLMEVRSCRGVAV